MGSIHEGQHSTPGGSSAYSSPLRMQQIQQTRECHKHVAGPGVAVAGTETSRIPPNVVPPDCPQGSRH